MIRGSVPVVMGPDADRAAHRRAVRRGAAKTATAPALRGFSTAASLLLGALALVHEVVYLATYGSAGYASAMQAGGHGRYWTAFILTVLLVVGSLAVTTIRQLVRLSRLATTMQSGGVDVLDHSVGRLANLMLRKWLVVAAGTLVAFVVQENVERIDLGSPLPGIAVIAGENAIAVPVVITVSVAIAFVAALAAWRREVLLTRLAAGRQSAPPRRAPRFLRPPVDERRPASFIAGRQNPVRAPPAPTRRHLVSA